MPDPPEFGVISVDVLFLRSLHLSYPGSNGPKPVSWERIRTLDLKKERKIGTPGGKIGVPENTDAVSVVSFTVK
jgi:hypothetical protein